MFVDGSRNDRCILHKRLLISLLLATDVVDSVAQEMFCSENYQWEKTFLGHTFKMSRGSCLSSCDSGKTVATAFRSWLQAHEEAQVMIASVLVVIGLWWMVRAVLALLINIICPILVVLLAVVCIPQLRTPLLGQNYPLLANLMREIFMKMAETLKN